MKELVTETTFYDVVGYSKSGEEMFRLTEFFREDYAVSAAWEATDICAFEVEVHKVRTTTHRVWSSDRATAA